MCHIASASIQNYEYIRLEFKGVGASGHGWLGCPDDVCDLAVAFISTISSDLLIHAVGNNFG